MSKYVGLTIKDILGLPAMKDARLLAGDPSGGDRIQLINIMADPEILDWIDRGQMLAMTAYILPGMSGEERLHFFRTCRDKGVVAVAIKIKPYLEQLDGAILTFLEETGFPVIEVPQDVPLAQVNAEVAGALFSRQANIIERFENIHQRFMDIILSGGGPPEIVSILSDYINNPVFFEVSYSRELITSWRSLRDEEQELIRKDYERFRSDRIRRSERRITEQEFARDGRRIRRKSIPIVLRDNIYGYLTSWSYDSDLTGSDLSVMEVAATVLSLLIMQSLSVREVEVKYASEFYEDLVAQDPQRVRRAMESHSYFDPAAPLHYAVLRAELIPLGGEEVEEHLNLAVRRLIHYLTPELEGLRYAFELDGLIATRANAVSLLLAFGQRNAYRPVMTRLATAVNDIMLRHFPGFGVSIGIGRLKESYENIRDSHEEARRSLAVSARSGDSGMRFYEDLGIYSLLLGPGQEEEIRDFARRYLGPLEAYDDRMKGQLFDTLEAYFKTGGNLMEMSRELYLHYNSVLYRLNRIQEITGLNLEEEDQKLNLAVALKIRKLLPLEQIKEGQE
ncbi:helix-turn-helix domain-containing protein [Proteiniclasticum sp. QWL-01]|uniref:PucR family transcriptional regulator n=1 Tax=Proteiniclasticum sp. QWL-01 TaxID=3036945 RepID=UPI00240EDC80|nr:helix-turn-helix domain-containing protein [Proteiniclasticum sp. QWL-01]WFF72800.1 helix-turn-helix domain-containing protein [Proteiniclasticum sp. QWL-01]